MGMSSVAEVQDQIQKFWSPLFTKELREQLLLGSLVNKDYQGEIKQQGDTVYVSQISAPAGSLKTVGTDADEFDSDTLVTTRVPIVANKRATAAFELSELADLQSQIGSAQSAIRESLMYSVEKQINDYLYSIIAPSAGSPDHVLNSVSTMDASQVLAIRELAAVAKWLKDKSWYGLMDPAYYNNILAATTMTSRDYTGGDQPTVSGQVATQRFGFNLLEDNSLSNKEAYFFHPDFMHLVMQTQARFKVSDLHANKKFGYLVSVDMIFGAAQGIAGDKKVISVSGS
jgi:hypothetical protein